TTDSTAALTGNGVKVVALPEGIHLPGKVDWQIEITIQVDTDFQWVHPVGGAGSSLELPDLTWELEQIRVGDGWGVPIP
ncbi:MAG: hypothetical protein LBO20_00680, partial [Bifidobacteriaceae bacterium]|nr:hypothetical protein [Bifidobacteriaceae bacterium]